MKRNAITTEWRMKTKEFIIILDLDIIEHDIFVIACTKG